MAAVSQGGRGRARVQLGCTRGGEVRAGPARAAGVRRAASLRLTAMMAATGGR